MNKRITWPEKNMYSDPDHNTYFLGRNGTGKAGGVVITDFNHKSVGRVRIDPLTRQSITRGKPREGRAWIEFPAAYAGAVADAIREAAGLFPVREGIRCAKCGSDIYNLLDDDNRIYTYRCDCGHEGTAAYIEIITEIT
ncbi:hypothetical protein M0R72_06400 [Candidatus Pacearchaeota archaeon]|nr:hypothetical protein [Candidatus Pacearchaeota archaeon]